MASIWDQFMEPQTPSVGLLDPASYDPRADMILSIAGQLLNNAGPSTTRQGILAGLPQAIQQGRQAGAQRAAQAMQFQAAKTKADQDAKAQAARTKLAEQMRQAASFNAGVQAMPGTTSPAQQQFMQTAQAAQPTQTDLLATFGDAYPDQMGGLLGKQLFPEEYTLGAGDVRMRGNQQIGAGAAKPGPFSGTGDAQFMNVLLDGDPASSAYRAAYNQLAQERYSLDAATGQMVTTRPDMSAYRQPVGQSAAAPFPTGATQAPAQPPQMGAPGGVTTKQVQAPKLTTAQENDLGSIRAQRSTIAGAIDAVNGSPGSFGIQRGIESKLPLISGRVLGPDAVTARSMVLNNVSSIITERAGAAQSAQELKRIEGFLPTPTDDAPTILAKLKAFNAYLDEKENGIRGPQSGGWSARVVKP